MKEHNYQTGDKALYKTWAGINADYHEVEVPVTVVRVGPKRVFIQREDGKTHWCNHRKLSPVNKKVLL